MPGKGIYYRSAKKSKSSTPISTEEILALLSCTLSVLEIKSLLKGRAVTNLPAAGPSHRDYDGSRDVLMTQAERKQTVISHLRHLFIMIVGLGEGATLGFSM